MKYTPEQITELLEEVQTAMDDAAKAGSLVWVKIKAPTWLQKLMDIVRQQDEKIASLNRQLEAKLIFINNGWEEERYSLQERLIKAEASATEAWKEYDNLKAEMEALGVELQSAQTQLEEWRERCRQANLQLEEQDAEIVRLKAFLACEQDAFKNVQAELDRIKASQETE